MAHAMSEVQCVACMLGRTPSARKRGMSASARICACSTRRRARRAAAGWRASACSNVSSVSVFARSPIACTHTWKPRVDRLVREPGELVRAGSAARPRLSGSSQYGECSAAPREPSAPSDMSLSGAHDHPTVADHLGAAIPIEVPGLLRASGHGGVVPERKLPALDEASIRGQREQGNPHLVQAGGPELRGTRRWPRARASSKRASDGMGLGRAGPAAVPYRSAGPWARRRVLDDDAARRVGGVSRDTRPRRTPPSWPRSRGRRCEPAPRDFAAPPDRASLASESAARATGSGPSPAR